MENKSISSCPAKIILFGEQCVVHGARAIATSLDLRTYCKFVPHREETIELNLPDIQKSYSWPFESLKYDGILTNESKAADEGFLLFLENITKGDKGAIAFLYLVMSIAGDKIFSRGGFKVLIVSDFQPGVGMGSSAAFNVSIATSTLMYFGLEREIETQPIEEDDSYLSPCHNLKTTINAWAFEAEKIMHGRPSGIDNSICTFGRAISFKKGTIETIDHVPSLQIIVTNTKVPRSTKILVENVGKLHQKLPHISSHLFETVNNISEEILSIFSKSKTSNSEEISLLEKDFETLIDINQGILNAIGVGHESLDNVVRTGKRYSFHTKLTGAGGGGCAFTLIPIDTPEERLEQFEKDIEAFGYQTFRAKIGAPGVYIHKDMPSIFRKYE